MTGAGRWHAPAMGLLLIVAAGLAAGANAWKRDLRVTHVSVYGNRIVKNSEILSLAGIPSNEKLFRVDLFAVRRRVENNLFIRSASVNREAPDGISITVEERRPIAVLVTDRTLFVDDDGYVLPPVRSDDIFDLPAITGDLPETECRPGKTVSSPGVREALEILAVAQAAGEETSHLLSEIHLAGEKDIVLYATEAGVPVVFGHGNTAEKLVKLEAFWKQIVAQRGPGDLGSVDLRFADQVVARWRNDPDAQQ
jgi:cell division protein FtsQ